MKRMSRKTFLINQIQYLADTESRSVKEWVRKDSARADEVILAFLVETNKFYINSSIPRLAELSKIAYDYTIGIESRHNKVINKHFGLFENYISKEDHKKTMTTMINDTKHLSYISKELGLNYGNVYRYFIKGDPGALKYGTVQDVIIMKKRILGELRWPDDYNPNAEKGKVQK